MISLKWSPLAKRCLEEIQAYKTQTVGKSSSDKFVARLLSTGAKLVDFPLMGRVVEDLGDPHKREVIESAYRILYTVDSLQEPTEVTVIGVIHSIQLPENTLLRELFGI